MVTERCDSWGKPELFTTETQRTFVADQEQETKAESKAADEGVRSALFEDAVVQFLAAPVGCGLDEGEDYGMWIFFRRR